MSTETFVRTKEMPVRTTEAPVSPLDRIAEEVRRDSQVDADQYLDETIVRHGGE
jgi:hypothetical protein